MRWWPRCWAFPRPVWATGCDCHPRDELDDVGSADKATKVSPEQMEIARLRAENARLRMERDIATKAVAYFAQDTLRGTPGLTK